MEIPRTQKADKLINDLTGTQRGDRMSRYGCEGTTLQLSCPQGELLQVRTPSPPCHLGFVHFNIHHVDAKRLLLSIFQVVRANYGRFSLEVNLSLYYCYQPK